MSLGDIVKSVKVAETAPREASCRKPTRRAHCRAWEPNPLTINSISSITTLKSETF